jgi:hypothetical protein
LHDDDGGRDFDFNCNADDLCIDAGRHKSGAILFQTPWFIPGRMALSSAIAGPMHL